MVGARAQHGVATCSGRSEKPCRWADVHDDGSEGEDDIEDLPLQSAPRNDDSYRDPPLSVLEDSRDGLRGRLSSAAGLNAASPEASAPKDFAFLLTSGAGKTDGSEPKDAEEPAASAGFAADSSPSKATTWRPNLNAPEFIPTLSHTCPLVGTVVLREDGRSVASRPQDICTPEKGEAPSHGLPALERRRRGALKGRPPAIQVAPVAAPAKKRTVQEPGAATKGQPPEKMPMPEVSEEDWLHRFQMRRKAIDIGKKTKEYQWHLENRKGGEVDDEHEPSTPNPTDRTVSKRRWKYDVMQWRIALKQRYIDEVGGSVVSTEEWQSVLTATTEDAEALRSIDLDDGLSV